MQSAERTANCIFQPKWNLQHQSRSIRALLIAAGGPLELVAGCVWLVIMMLVVTCLPVIHFRILALPEFTRSTPACCSTPGADL